MGAYVYMIRGPQTRQTIWVDGQPHEAGVAYYLYKPWWGWDTEKYNRPYTAQIARMGNLWQGIQTPKYVIISGDTVDVAGHSVRCLKVKPGSTVLEWRQGAICVVDDPDWQRMPVIGCTIERNGRMEVTKDYEAIRVSHNAWCAAFAQKWLAKEARKKSLAVSNPV